MEASENGHEEVVRMLLSAGASPDLKDKVSGTSPKTCSNLQWQVFL